MKMLTYILSTLLVFGVLGFALCVCKAASVEFPAIEPAPLSVKRVIESIAEVEAWDGVTIGRNGERGRLQFKAGTWQDFSTKPHHWAEGRTLAAQLELEAVEQRYVLWMIHAWSTLGKKGTPYLLGLMHNAGYGNVVRGRMTAHAKDFGSRVANIYEGIDL